MNFLGQAYFAMVAVLFLTLLLELFGRKHKSRNLSGSHTGSLVWDLTKGWLHVWANILSALICLCIDVWWRHSLIFADESRAKIWLGRVDWVSLSETCHLLSRSQLGSNMRQFLCHWKANLMLSQFQHRLAWHQAFHRLDLSGEGLWAEKVYG